jgi:hypothetical protein
MSKGRATPLSSAPKLLPFAQRTTCPRLLSFAQRRTCFSNLNPRLPKKAVIPGEGKAAADGPCFAIQDQHGAITYQPSYHRFRAKHSQ